MEFYDQGTFHPSSNQPMIDFGARYKIHSPIIFLLMAGRSLEGAQQPGLFSRLFRDVDSRSNSYK